MFNDILNRNFFALFELPLAYDIDLAQAQQRYIALQSKVHPDKFASASDTQKRIAMQLTSHINEALQTLKDPVLRASYLLKLKGLDINLETETTMDAVFLMQQLELRESMSDIRNHYNSATDALAALDRMGADVNKKIQAAMSNFSALLDSDQLEEAREWVRKLQFLQKAKQEVNQLGIKIEDELMG